MDKQKPQRLRPLGFEGVYGWKAKWSGNTTG